MDFATLTLVTLTLAATALYALAFAVGTLSHKRAMFDLECTSEDCDKACNLTHWSMLDALESAADFAALRASLAALIAGYEQVERDETARIAALTARTDRVATLAAPRPIGSLARVESERPAGESERPISLRPAGMRARVSAVRPAGESNAVFAQVNGAWIMLRTRESERPAVREIIACELAA